MSAENEKEKRELEKKVKELEEKVRRLEEEKSKESKAQAEKPEEEHESIAGSTLKGLVGNIMPGLGDLISTLEKSDAFQERLKEIDVEIETRLKTGTLEGAGGSGRRSGRAHMVGRPPGAGSPGARSRLAKRTAPPVRRKPPVTVEEPLVDVFDEKDQIKVVATLPGVEEKDIKVDISGAQLTISADTPDRKYHKEITLPAAPDGEVERMYKNGIFGITLKKESETDG